MAGLFLGILLLLSLSLWRVLRLQRENLLKAQVIEATQCGVLVTDATLPHHPIRQVNVGGNLTADTLEVLRRHGYSTWAEQLKTDHKL